MSLTPGTRLGPYEVVALIGEGGMGQVYSARDTTLDRSVALKILPAAFAADPDRLARFEREAKALAALNHPNIAQIYGVQESSGPGVQGVTRALVMELVDGEDLAQRIARGPLPLDEALAIAKQIADALDAAHEQGIIHRDLKPANIKVRQDNTVKVLDFGLARASEPDGGRNLATSLTMTSPAMTAMGVILGTAAYMSPEQAKGRRVDKRADIWAFGVVLFEMLTGTRPFDVPRGDEDNLAETISAVLTREPKWDALPPDVPASVRATLRRLLEKDARRRLRDIGDADLTPRDEALLPPRRSSVTLPLTLAAATLIIGALLGRSVGRSGEPQAPAVARLSVTLPDEHPYLVDTYPGRSLAIAPDGSKIAYVARDATAAGGRRVFIRSLDAIDPQPMSGAEDATQPFFSPDGSWIGFFANTDRVLRTLPLSGGAPVALVRGLLGPAWSHASWGDNQWIAHDSENGTTGLVAVNGGERRTLKPPAGSLFSAPRWISGTDAILVTVISSDGDRVEAMPSDGANRQTVVPDASWPMYLASGHLLFVRDGAILVAPFDRQTQRVTGPAVPVPIQVKVDNRNQRSPMPQLAVSENGTLVYVPTTGRLDRESTLLWLSQTGAAERIGTIPAGAPDLRLSPDGTRLAIARRMGRLVRYEVMRLDGMTTTLVADVPATYPAVPVWHPDGRHIVVTQTAAGGDQLWLYNVDGAGGPRRLAELKGRSYVSPHCFTRDGRFLSVTGYTGNNADVLVADMSGDAAAEASVRTFAATGTFEANGCLSPDGTLLTYESEESGRSEIYVRRFPSGEGVTRVSRDGGSRPRWSPRGDHIYFVWTSLMASAVEPGAQRFGTPREIYRSPSHTGLFQGTSFDVSPSGRLLIRELPEDPYSAREIVVVQNWFRDVARLTGTR